MRSKKFLQVARALDANSGCGEYAEGEVHGVAGGANTFLQTLDEEWSDPIENGLIIDALNKATHEEEEAVRRHVISRTANICAVEKNFVDPVESLGEVVPAAVLVEER